MVCAPFTVRAGVLALCLLGSAASAQAQTSAMQSWQAAQDRAQQAYAAGDLAQAEQAARDALRQARAGQGDNQSFVAGSLNLLALVRQRQGHAADAAALLEEALAVSAQSAADPAATAALALNFGNALDALGRGDQALAAWQRSADIAERLPPDAPVRAQALSALARAHAARGETEPAARYNQRLLDDRMALSPALKADALERQALIDAAQGQSAAARAALAQALALREQGAENDPMALLRTLSALAAMLTQDGDHDAAAGLHGRAVALLEQSAPQAQALAGHLNELGLWQLQRREYATAAHMLERALVIVAGHDANSLETARISANLAQLHEARGEGAKAQALYARALAIYEEHGDAAEPLLGQAQALNFLAGQDYRQRRLAQAEARFLRALALTEQAAGAQSPRLLPLLDNLVTLYRSQQREGQARAHAERAERLRSNEAREMR
ncbi:tetratricopeptide repeat protein [Pantoea sp. 18069]|uniref:tetratricopeptide repeat protein n=1 Tax=Pantoea sp. 18069 TaxID=2681415 RepID=UPI0013584016|nr:tetratricopeptide repeat protein [Pantoea sp. 18069]